MNIWSGDLRLTDDDSHKELEQYLETITEYLDLEYCFIKTNAREMFCENELERLTIEHVGKKMNHGWRATIAHTFSITSATISWLLKNQISAIYFGSSYQQNDTVHDANNRTLLTVMGCKNYRVESIDENLERNKKVEQIVK